MLELGHAQAGHGDEILDVAEAPSGSLCLLEQPVHRFDVGVVASVEHAAHGATEMLLQSGGQPLEGLDMAVLFNGQVYLFEFKVVELAPEGKALQQLQDRAYADKYRARGEPIHLIGVEFSRESRSVVGFEVDRVGARSGERHG